MATNRFPESSEKLARKNPERALAPEENPSRLGRRFFREYPRNGKPLRGLFLNRGNVTKRAFPRWNTILFQLDKLTVLNLVNGKARALSVALSVEFDLAQRSFHLMVT